MIVKMGAPVKHKNGGYVIINSGSKRKDELGLAKNQSS